MSNDVDYQITISAKTRTTLVKVLSYLKAKKVRWDAHKDQGGVSSELMAEVGAKIPAEVVSWGFRFGPIKKLAKSYKVRGTAWANENVRNVSISGAEGELAVLQQKFSDVVIKGTYCDEDGDEGSVSGPDFSLY